MFLDTCGRLSYPHTLNIFYTPVS